MPGDSALGAQELSLGGDCREKPDVPPRCCFTHRNSQAAMVTNITLEDGCFGIASLMRMAALAAPLSPGDPPGSPDDKCQKSSALEERTNDAAARGQDKGSTGGRKRQAGDCKGNVEQFSIEIIRCCAVCPDWQDNALIEAPVSGRPDIVVLGVPHLLLQLPATSPAHHPRVHPVQVGFPKPYIPLGTQDAAHTKTRNVVFAVS